MAGIITLLFESPLLLFFLIAALLSFFQGKGKEQKTGQNRRPQSGQEQQPDEINWEDIFRQEEPQTEQEPVSKPQNSSQDQRDGVDRRTTAEKESDPNTHMSDEWQRRYREIERRKREAAKSQAKISQSPIEMGDLAAPKKPKISLDFSHVSRDEAVKGVIWAEILGKPKSRRGKETPGRYR